ncbi:16S rRNA (cytosine(1402)-N(4))-methyltransferase RsmH [Candidatus Bathyarchaeota archaeon]|jgi:16S rRNA (cytosine1402-N4)-methyltransferase|nr:16S rRNA (cytosine(1402)-N(4))-methyltransferase RsmH [Candidatus Bathyarchaeota archaeon]
MTPKNKIHIPVMLKEVLEHLAPEPGKRYIDATLGAAGHTLAILETGATVLGIDRDQEIIEIATDKIKEAGLSTNFTTLRGSFADLLQPSRSDLVGSDYDGILFDLGVSSYQLDTPERGFSFRFDAPLDMRMDPENQAVTAADLINGLGRNELVKLFKELSEERYAALLADVICDARKQNPITTTLELAELIESRVKRTGRLHPATRIFQSLRMAVNTERDELKAVLPSALSNLKPGGVIIVISFHSGEDSIVKAQIADWLKEGLIEAGSNLLLTTSSEEALTNPRSRSAKLRVIRKKVS